MAQNGSNGKLEPWLRESRQEAPPVLRAVLHALDLAREDFERWVWPFYDEMGEERPFALPSPGFQARHIVRSLDRLLTYAEGEPLSEMQLTALAAEHQASHHDIVKQEFTAGLLRAEQRVLALATEPLSLSRFVGRARIPTTLGGLLVHLADHTQRHAGQAVTTAKVLLALQEERKSR